MSDVVRVGVVGAGAIAQVAHLVVLSKLEGVEIIGLCDPDIPKAQALSRRFSVPYLYDDIEDLLARAKPDAVVICTPNHLHQVHTVSVLSAGIPVLCERPLALSAKGAERVLAAQEAADVPLLVGMNLRYRNDVQAVRSFLVGGELGSLRSVRAHWHIFRPTGIPAGWRERRAESGGGAMVDLGLPLLDLALWLAECPATKRVSAMFSSRNGADRVEDFAGVHLQCSDGHSIFVDVSWRHVGAQEKFGFELVGDQGSASFAPLSVYKEMHGAPVNVTPQLADHGQDPFSRSYWAEWEHFLQIVRGESDAPDLAQHLLLHRTLDAIQQSAREGREITL